MSRINVRNIARIDLNLLLTFHCLMTERSATRASALLHVTQGAVSSALRRLREHFDDELFIRTASGMQPTRKAMELAPKIAEALTSVSCILSEEPGFAAHDSDYTFKVAMSDDLEAYLAPKLVSAAAQAGLKIRFAFHQTNSSLWKQALADPDMDLVICCEPKDFSTAFSSVVLFSSSYSCLHRPLEGARGRPINLAEYYAAAHVRISYDSRRGFIDDHFEAAGHVRHVAASFTHFSGALTALSSSDLIATLPSFAAEAYAQITGLEHCAVPFPVPSFRCFMVWDHAKQNQAHHDWLRQFVSDLCAHLPRESLSAS